MQDADRAVESSTWNVVTSKRTGDIYFSGRDVMGELKISLHESGVNRLAWTSEVAASRVPPGSDRVVTRWTNAELLPEGWSLALRLSIPDSSLSQIVPPLRTKPTETIGAVGPGRVYVIRLLVAGPGAGTLDLYGESWGVVGQMAMGDGRKLVVTVWDHPTTDELEATAEAIRTQALAEGAAERELPRCVGWGYDDDSGIPAVVDAGDPRPHDRRPRVFNRYEGPANVTISTLRAQPEGSERNGPADDC